MGGGGKKTAISCSWRYLGYKQRLQPRKFTLKSWTSSNRRNARRTNQNWSYGRSWQFCERQWEPRPARGLQKSSSPLSLLSEDVLRLFCCQSWACSSNPIINQRFAVWKAHLQTNSIQDETPHLKPTLSLFDLAAYTFNKIKWVIWVISGFPFLCNQKPNRF